jgi:nucleosome assembly protein 1-like 1
MLFEFSQNEFFENTILEKQYFLNKEMLIERIESSTINWKEGKSLAHKTVKKTLKNKSIIILIKETGDKKTVEVLDEKDSFFNFFSNVRLPTTEEMKNIDFELEKDLGQHFDTEYEFAMEFAEDIIPHALEYFMGIKHDSEEYIEYIVRRCLI